MEAGGQGWGWLLLDWLSLSQGQPRLSTLPAGISLCFPWQFSAHQPGFPGLCHPLPKRFQTSPQPLLPITWPQRELSRGAMFVGLVDSGGWTNCPQPP